MGAAEVTAIGTAICPTMAYTAVEMVTATNCPFLGVGTAITVAAGRDNRVTAASQANVIADVGTDVVTNGVSPITSAGGFLKAGDPTVCRGLAAVVTNGVSPIPSAGGFLKAGDPTVCRGLAAVATKAYLCPCEGKVPQTAPTNCGVCGCTDLGVPTNAPTAIPTTAPTAVTGSPTGSSPSVSS